MEATLNSKRIEQLIEQPDLYEIYQELEGTIGGITLPLKDLAKMCPIDLNDPRISLEDKNKFVITGLNNAQAEISSEHVTIFKNTLEVQGRQPNFKIAKQDNSEHSRVTEPRAPEVQLSPKSWTVVQSKVKEDKLPVTILQEIISLNNLSLEPNDVNTLKEQAQNERSQIPDSNRPPDQLVTKNSNFFTKDKSFMQSEVPTPYHKPLAAPERSRAPQDSKIVSIPEIKPSNPEVVDKLEIIPVTSGDELDQLDIELASEDQPIWEDFVTASGIPVPQEVLVSNEDIDSEYENLSFVNNFQVRLLNSVGIGSASEHNEQNNMMPVQEALAIKIIEGIDNLDPKLLPSLKAILDEIDISLSAINMEDYREEDELINEIQLLRIQELTSQLFELCKVECSASEKNDFIALILNPEFRIPAINLVAVDLENTGTREVKRKQKISSSNLGSIRDKIQKIIGDFVLSLELIIDNSFKYPI